MKYPKQNTVRTYLHFTRAKRLVMLMRDNKIVDLSLSMRTHYGQKGAAFMLLGSDGEQPDFKRSSFDVVHGGYPFYTLRSKDVSGADILFEVFASTGEIPVTHFRATVSAAHGSASGSLSFLPCTAENDKYLTGLWDTGYEPYAPNMRAWTMLDTHYKLSEENGTTVLCDGYAILALSGAAFTYTGDTLPNFEPSRYLSLPFDLHDGESVSVEGIFSTDTSAAFSPFDEAKSLAKAAWDGVFDHITAYPDTDDEKTRDIFLAQITACLQMIAVYDDGTVYPRQGCVGRYVWAWEAAYLLTALDRVGLYDRTREPLETLLEKWMITDEASDDFGLIANPRVNWANTNGSVLWCVCEHLKYTADAEQYKAWKPYLAMAHAYIERKRHSSTAPDLPGLFPSAVASDWGEVGQHYTYTDGVNLMGYRSYLAASERFGDPDAEYIRGTLTDYEAVFASALASLTDGHTLTDDPAHPDFDYMPTHILGKPFSEVRTHCYTTDGIIYLPMCGNLDAKSRLLAFVERYYERHRLFDHGLTARMTNLDFGYVGVYGDCYYTGVAEVCWYYIYRHQGKDDKAKEMLDSLLYYNLTDEYVTSERYAPRETFYAPWQPNGSASGRIIHVLLDHYGHRR